MAVTPITVHHQTLASVSICVVRGGFPVTKPSVTRQLRKSVCSRMHTETAPERCEFNDLRAIPEIVCGLVRWLHRASPDLHDNRTTLKRTARSSSFLRWPWRARCRRGWRDGRTAANSPHPAGTDRGAVVRVRAARARGAAGQLPACLLCAREAHRPRAGARPRAVDRRRITSKVRGSPTFCGWPTSGTSSSTSTPRSA